MYITKEAAAQALEVLSRVDVPEASDPTEETTQPTDATEESTAPSEETKPEESSEPTVETEPVETSKPTDATQPEESSEPTVETEPEETTKPTDATEPEETTKPTDATEPEETVEPFDPDAVELPFSDVNEKHWFRDAVAFVYHHKLMNGVSNTSFAPNQATTRAMIVTVLYRIAGSPKTTADAGFVDVKAGSWYADAVNWAAENGVVNGMDATHFAPDNNVTREQLVTMLLRYSTLMGYDTSVTAQLGSFPDANKVSTWASQAMSWAIGAGLITGSQQSNGTVLLLPGDNAQRAQIAAILQRFMENY